MCRVRWGRPREEAGRSVAGCCGGGSAAAGAVGRICRQPWARLRSFIMFIAVTWTSTYSWKCEWGEQTFICSIAGSWRYAGSGPGPAGLGEGGPPTRSPGLRRVSETAFSAVRWWFWLFILNASIESTWLPPPLPMPVAAPGLVGAGVCVAVSILCCRAIPWRRHWREAAAAG